MTALLSLYPRLSKEIRTLLERLPRQEAETLEEIRVYLKQPVELVMAGKRKRTELFIDERMMDNLLAALSGFALYRFERQMAQGYIPLEGGHRAGVCGAMTRLEDGTWKMSGVLSVCIRIARGIKGASLPLREHLFSPGGSPRRVLLIGPPGCGKTTVLRDAALYMAGYVHVAVADEREELFARSACMGVENMDVLSGMDKAQAFCMLIRSMAPQVIVCDELGREEDVQAVLDAARCGVGVLASAHANGLDDLLNRPMMRCFMELRVFERYIYLGRHGVPLAVWDETGRRMERGEREKHGQLGNGGDGDDRREQRRISLVGR